MALNFNAEPYYDNFDEAKKFYRILFKPGYAVQTRELNQLQSIIQSQISTHGKHIFKEGSMVIPGNTSVDTNASYVKLATDIATASLVGTVLTGQTSGVTAQVVFGVDSEGSDPSTLYVKYTSSGTDTITKVFDDNEVLLDDNAVAIVTTKFTDATGVGSIASVEKGWYFLKNSFVYVAAQTIALEKYLDTPTYRIGLESTESFITSDEDITLLDNAQGSFNYAAPGADRYSIDLTLTKKNVSETTAGAFIIGQQYTITVTGNTDFVAIGSTDNLVGTVFTATGNGSGTGAAIINEENFIQLILVKDGSVIQKMTATDYSILEQTMARRTFDESGDYTVKNFPIDVREYRNNFRGDWVAYGKYLAGDVVLNGDNYYRCRQDGIANATAPTQSVGSTTSEVTGVIWTYEKSPFFNRGIYTVQSGESLVTQNTNKAKLAIGVEPGKAYVRGYEIEKVGIEYVPVNKARDFLQKSNVNIPATVGNYILVYNINALPNILTYPTVTLYNQYSSAVGVATGTAIGTARIRYIEFNSDTAPGTQDTKYKLSLFNISMNSGYNFNRDVKQLYIAGGSTALNFTADVFPVLTQLSGAVTASNSSTVSGTGTLFLTELKVGDYVSIDDNIRRVEAIVSNNVMTVNDDLLVEGVVFSRIGTNVLETENESLIYPATNPYVSVVEDDTGNVNTSYTVLNRYTQDSNLGGVITLSITGSDDIFGSPALSGNYLVLDVATGEIIVPTDIAYGTTTQQVLITTPTASVKSYVVIAAVDKAGSATEKAKTLTTATVTYTSRNAATSSNIKLGKTDGYRILEVKMDAGTFSSPAGSYTIDITDRYLFDDGQKSTHYDVASINLISGNSAPSAPIQVVFEYFAHSGTGDHFTVNSYLSTIDYEEIPSFNGVSLAYVFDFRPTINDAGTAFSTVSLLPKRGIDIQTDFQYYIGRKDKLILNQNGSLFTVSGTSALNPVDPSDSSSGMVLYKLQYQPYTFAPNMINIESIDNKRYTMRDIGKLEKRIDNIEYYTTLSMLEQQAQSLEIQDETGLNRFKNGFIVDNFTGHNIGDVNSIDYDCAVDMENSQLRPSYYMDNINLIEQNINESQRDADNYQVTGDLITLPYTEVELASQLDSSTVENINPFAIFTFLGSTELTPPSDEWFETNRLVDVVTNVEGNFNSVYAAEERSGALNGIWNAWQTVWTGAPVTTKTTYSADRRSGDGGAALDAQFGVVNGRGWAIRSVTTETTARTLGQSRTGIKSTVVARVDTVQTADRTLSVALIPYIRARSLLFVIKGLKPNTTFTPFFDSVDISTFVTQATQMTVSRNTIFSATVPAGGDATEDGRLVNNSVQTALSKGDLIYVKQRGATIYTKETSPATAVLSLVTNELNGTTTTLHVVNVKGSFTSADILGGSITGAEATLSATPTIKTQGQSLVTNAAGEISGVFDIPNTSSNRFRTGVREFKLSDDSTGVQGTSTSKKQYRAEGVIETKQASFTATRNADVQTQAINDFQTITQTSSRVVSDTGWYDPLAQTFLVASEGGAFVTSVDIYFASKDTNIPVRMQIREVVNGYPGKTIVPFSEVVVEPINVNISGTTVNTSAGETWPKPIATNFKFPSPVYLNDKTEYCIVLISDSNNYRAWISELGQTSVVNNKIISEQPYAGVLFKSQNASTWTANQNQDLMFKINKARFTTEQYGEVDFVNTEIPALLLKENPFYTVNGTNYIRVTHENHGMFAGSTVVISGADSVGGIANNQINTSHDIISAEYDSYVIQTSSNASYTGNFGGSAVYATENIQFSTLQPIVQEQVFSGTDMSHFIQTHSGKSIDGSETAYDISALNPVAVNQNNVLTDLQMIGTSLTETDSMSGVKSFKLRSRMITHNENISPVIDTARLSVITIQNRINSPSASVMNVSALDTRTVVSANSLVSITNSNRFTTADATTKLAFLTANKGRYIVTTGFATAANNSQFLVTDVAADGSYIEVVDVLSDGSFDTAPLTNVSSGVSITINSLDRFVHEIAPLGSSSIAKYVSSKINLQNPSTFLKIRFAADVEQLANIDVYYKLQPFGSVNDFSKQIYVKAESPVLAAVKSDNGLFSDVEYDIANLPVFNAVQVKLVMNSTSSDIVRVKDLQIIGCA